MLRRARNAHLSGGGLGGRGRGGALGGVRSGGDEGSQVKEVEDSGQRRASAEDLARGRKQAANKPTIAF
jgi:hypothetical protein